ncbi:MAG TPA: hypothetical protein PLY56_10115, partial [Armatimonadota bacterium]|nr:hypothetical protein [Armatimonadota bacterium]
MITRIVGLFSSVLARLRQTRKSGRASCRESVAGACSPAGNTRWGCLAEPPGTHTLLLQPAVFPLGCSRGRFPVASSC